LLDLPDKSSTLVISGSRLKFTLNEVNVPVGLEKSVVWHPPYNKNTVERASVPARTGKDGCATSQKSAFNITQINKSKRMSNL